MKSPFWLVVGLSSSALLLTGCDKKNPPAPTGHEHSDHAAHDQGEHKHEEHEHAEGGPAEHDHGEHAHAEGEAAHEDSGVTFDEKLGLRFSPEVNQALGLTIGKATRQRLAANQELTTQVFSTAPRVLASARVPVGQIAQWEKSAFTNAKLLRIDRSTATATGQVDLLFELAAPAAPTAVGDFITLSAVSELTDVIAVPRSAVYDGATGPFVYVVTRDASYLRTPVKTGIRSTDFVQIIEGLPLGGRIVVAPVEQLWLAELRLTKGGGHSH